MSLGFFNYELEKLSIEKNIRLMLDGKDPDYPLKAIFQSKDDWQYYCFVKSLDGFLLEPPRPICFYLIIYKQGSPNYMVIDRDYEKSQYQVQKLTKNQFNWKMFWYKFSGIFKRLD
jgi:hypothetical protein